MQKQTGQPAVFLFKMCCMDLRNEKRYPTSHFSLTESTFYVDANTPLCYIAMVFILIIIIIISELVTNS